MTSNAARRGLHVGERLPLYASHGVKVVVRRATKAGAVPNAETQDQNRDRSRGNALSTRFIFIGTSLQYVAGWKKQGHAGTSCLGSIA